MIRLAILLLLVPSVVLAQSGLPQPSSGDLWISFDEVGNRLCTQVPTFTTDNVFYILTQDIAGGIAGYEFALNIDPSVIVFAAADQTNPGSINVGTPPSWIVGIGLCAPATGMVPLVQYTYGVFDQSTDERFICQLPSEPSSFSPATPGYLGCMGELVPFTVHPGAGVWWPPGCSFFYSPAAPVNFDFDTCSLQGVVNSSDSWSGVKSRFR